MKRYDMADGRLLIPRRKTQASKERGAERICWWFLGFLALAALIGVLR